MPGSPNDVKQQYTKRVFFKFKPQMVYSQGKPIKVLCRRLYEKTRKGFLKFKPSMVFYSYGKSLKFFSCGLSEKTHKGFISKLFKLSVYTYIILILINQWLLNLIFGMRKAMNVQNSSKQNFHPPPPLHFSMLFGTSYFNYCLVSSLFPPFFISNFINFF